MITTITISDLTTNNPVLILAAMIWNALYTIAALVLSSLQAVASTLTAFVANYGRLLVTVAGLVAAVVAVIVFWWAILVTAGVLGGMYAGLKLVMLHQR